MTRAELIELQQAVAQKRAPKLPTDAKFWHPESSLHLHLRLYPSGRGVWFTNYDTPRRRGRSWKIGDAAVINTTAAEKEAKKIQGRVQLGEDPQAERKDLRQRPRLTVRGLCREFFDEVHKDPKFSPKTERGYRSVERLHLGALGDLMFDELCARQNVLVTHVRKLAAEVSPHTASRFRDMLSGAYRWAMSVYPDNISRNPVTGTWSPGYTVEKRGQALTMEQLGAVWRACEEMEREAVPTYRGNGLGGSLTASVRAKTDWVSTTEAAKIAQMHRKTLLDLMHAGHIKAIVRPSRKSDKIKHYLFSADDLKRLTDQRLSTMRSVDLEYSVIVRLMILFGSRYGEMAKLAWSEINLEEAVLHIPTINPDGARRLKSNRGAPKDLTIYMPALAVDLINKIPRRPGRDYLFGIGPHGLTENDLQKKALDAIILKNEGAPIVHRSTGADGKPRDDHWTLHWLRHSFSTRLDEDLGVDVRIIRAITNHLSPQQKSVLWGGGNEAGMHWRYTHSTYPLQQRQVLERWAKAILDAAHHVEPKHDEKIVWSAFQQKTDRRRPI